MNESRPQVPLLLSSVLLIFLAQMTLNPIIAPLSREVGLAEWQIGVTISCAALMLVLTSQFWGRRSQSLGRKPVLVLAFTGATVTMALFALVAWLGVQGVVTGTALFVLFVLLRGIGFGASLSAVPATAQAYIADVTHDEAARVKGMAGIGAVQGIAMIGGSVLGGVLALAGLLAPLVAVPILVLLGLVLIGTRLRRETHTELIAEPARVSPLDSRVWPFLLAGFGMFTALGFIQVITGFIVQDRLGLSPQTTGVVTGGALFAAGLGMILAQAVVVPRSGWSPSMLLRVGTLVALVGFILYAIEGGLILLIVGILLIGLGLGIAMPGYTAGPSLLMSREEQGGMAGLIGANNGLTFVITPTLATALYGVWHQLPIILGAVVMAIVVAFVLVHPRFRKVAQEPATVNL